jgi:hypothetical protein
VLVLALPETRAIDSWLKDDFHTWVTTAGAKGQKRAEDSKRQVFYADDETGKLGHDYRQKLARYKDAWDLLGQEKRP